MASFRFGLSFDKDLEKDGVPGVRSLSETGAPQAGQVVFLRASGSGSGGPGVLSAGPGAEPLVRTFPHRPLKGKPAGGEKEPNGRTVEVLLPSERRRSQTPADIRTGNP